MLNRYFIYFFLVEEDSNEDGDKDDQEDYAEQEDAIEKEGLVGDAGIRPLISYEVKSVVHILLFLLNSCYLVFSSRFGVCVVFCFCCCFSPSCMMCLFICS